MKVYHTLSIIVNSQRRLLTLCTFCFYKMEYLKRNKVSNKMHCCCCNFVSRTSSLSTNQNCNAVDLVNPCIRLLTLLCLCLPKRSPTLRPLVIPSRYQPRLLYQPRSKMSTTVLLQPVDLCNFNRKELKFCKKRHY